MLSISLLSRFLSSGELIFLDMLTELIKGISTIKRPGNEMSQDNRWPLVEIGSLVICTSSGTLFDIVLAILPVFCVSGSNLKSFRSGGITPSIASLVNFCADLTCGPRSE